MPNHESAVILAAGVQDISDIQSIARATWAKTYAGIIPANVQHELLNSWYSSAGLEQVIRSDRTIFLVAKAERRAVGFAQFVQLSPETATLSRIYVLPEYQNRRIGSKLLASAISKLKTLGVERLSVEVERDNQIGRRFYARKGFKDLSEKISELDGYELPVMCCELAI